MKTLDKVCWLILLVFGIGGLGYYTLIKEEPVVQLDAWGESVLVNRDDTLSTGGTSYVDGDTGQVYGVMNDGDYAALTVDASGGLHTMSSGNALRVTIVGDDDHFGAQWVNTASGSYTEPERYLMCQDIDKQKWALLPKKELDEFKAYKSRQLR
jgi:hypothetical protein